MSQPSADAKAVVLGLYALTTHVKRIADALTTPVVQHVDATDDDATTPAERQHPYAAVRAHLRQLGDEMPGSKIQRDAMIWQAVNEAIDAYIATTPVPCPWDGTPLPTAPDAWQHFSEQHPEVRPVGPGPWPRLEQTTPADGADPVCRVMDTRTCPPAYNGPCGDRPCARFESDDPTPWLDTAPAAEPPADDADPAPNLLHVLVDRAARGVLTEGEAATFRRRVEQLVNGRATWKAKGEEMERDRDRLAAELTRSENARDHLRCRADAAEAEAERLRDLVIAENKRADDAINREDTADSAAEEQRGRAAAAEAAIERVRALVAGIAHPTSAGITQYDLGRQEMATAVVLAITEQPTTEA